MTIRNPKTGPVSEHHGSVLGLLKIALHCEQVICEEVASTWTNWLHNDTFFSQITQCSRSSEHILQ